MTDVAGYSFPSNRILSHWRQQFIPLHPTGFWFGHFLVQSIELTVGIAQQTKLDSLNRFVLQAIGPCERSIQQLADRLGLPIPSLLQILIFNRDKGLVDSSSDSWRLTDRGQSAWRNQSYPQFSYHRRTFSYLHLQPNRRPELLSESLSGLASWSGMISEDQRIHPSWVANSIQQSKSGTSENAPANRMGILSLPPHSLSDWRQIPIVRMESLPGLVIRSLTETEKVGFYPVFTDRWHIPTAEPIAILGAKALPESTEEDWRSSWIEWALHQGATLEDAESCSFTLQEDCLRVSPSERTSSQFVQFLENLLHEQEYWLFAGSETIKQANRILFSNS